MALSGLLHPCENSLGIFCLYHHMAIAPSAALNDQRALSCANRPKRPTLDAVIAAIAEEAGCLPGAGMAKSCGHSPSRVRVVIDPRDPLPGNTNTSLKGKYASPTSELDDERFFCHQDDDGIFPRCHPHNIVCAWLAWRAADPV